MSQIVDQLKAATPTLSVGILTANQMDLGLEIKLLEDAGCGLVHFDVMDGGRWPKITAGPFYIKGIKTNLLKDVHLLINDPAEKLGDYIASGADIITVHLGSEEDISVSLKIIKEAENANDPGRGIARGAALDPGTGVDKLTPLLDGIDMITLVTVTPDSGFDTATSERAGKVREMIDSSGKDILLAIDGGIKRDNIKEVAGMGADIVISGSAVFDGKAAAKNVEFMLEVIKQ